MQKMMSFLLICILPLTSVFCDPVPTGVKKKEATAGISKKPTLPTVKNGQITLQDNIQIDVPPPAVWKKKTPSPTTPPDEKAKTTTVKPEALRKFQEPTTQNSPQPAPLTPVPVREDTPSPTPTTTCTPPCKTPCKSSWARCYAAPAAVAAGVVALATWAATSGGHNGNPTPPGVPLPPSTLQFEISQNDLEFDINVSIFLPGGALFETVTVPSGGGSVFSSVITNPTTGTYVIEGPPLLDFQTNMLVTVIFNNNTVTTFNLVGDPPTGSYVLNP